MKVAAGYQFIKCEDGHIHLLLCDEDQEVEYELVLSDETEIREFIADLTEMINDKAKGMN